MNASAKTMSFSTLVLLMFITSALADDWAQPRALIYASPTGRHGLKVTPTSFQEAKARLFALTEQGGETDVWNRQLVNVPMNVWIAGDGNSVVSVDTYGRLGYAHSLVVYGKAGEVVADYALKTCLATKKLGNMH